MVKLNCWEFKKCNREPGGAKNKELGVCPTAQNQELQGVHGGKYAGRACWIVAESLCDGTVQGGFGEKYSKCQTCDFYLLVKQEEGFSFQLSLILLAKYKKKVK